ncbi:hypothetical protein [Maribellus mangrovi]|uniref:hypothetical protein n=1 Tax=Maribellus mangrovi TaxID=3133146 RepID=UPI0030EC9E26
MKTKSVLLAICVILLSVVANAKIKDGQSMSGNSLSELGQYTITHSEAPVIHDNQVLETYELRYENATNSVKIAVVEEKKCKTFIVRNDEFEVQYNCQNGVFGVKKIEKRFQEIPEEEMNMKLNRVSYYAQRVICQGKKSDDDYLGLIACYFPELVNEEYQASF